MEVDYRYEGFDELDEAGFKVNYMSLDKKNGVIRPAFPLEQLVEDGFLGRGKRVRYLNRNGYDAHREYAAKMGITEGMILTVDTCTVENWSSDYTFYEVGGSHNTVMFEEVEDGE